MRGVKRYDCTSGDARFCNGCYTMTECIYGDYVSHDDYAQLAADNQRLREALEFASKSLAQVTSSDGSGHADIAIAALRISGVDPTETVQMVEVWKKTAGWRLDAALTTANGEVKE
jgi:uncharacterized membrane protein YvbJ